MALLDPERSHTWFRLQRSRWLLVLALLSACTVSGHSSASPSSSLPTTPSSSPTPADRIVEPVAAAVVESNFASGTGGTTIAATDSVRVRKHHPDEPYGAPSASDETILLFPLPKECIRSATLELGTPNGAFPDEAISVYASALGTTTLHATSTPTKVSGYTLLDNRPRSIVKLTNGQAAADVTETARLWSFGGPFPSQELSVNPANPLALDVIQSDLTTGSFDVRFGKPTLRLGFSSAGPCPPDEP